MIIDKKETALAYRCPSCGATVTSIVGVFALSGDMIRLRCTCGQSQLTATYTSDRKIRLNVPCIACPTPHNYVLGQNTFFSRDSGVFRLPCAFTGIDACFIGDIEKVTRAVEQSNEELIKMMEDAGLDDLARIREDEEINVERDPQVEDIIRYTISELNEEGKITCKCQNNAIARFDFKMHDKGVTVFCDECGAFATLPITGLSSARDFLEIDSLTLDGELDE